MMVGRLWKNQQGLTLIEMLIAVTILAILASAVIPFAEVNVKRTKELELRRSLRLMRTAIDDYKADYDKAVAQKKISAVVGETGYPESLDILLEGTDWGGLYPYKRKYLRRLPRDPFDKYGDGWGLRAYEDDHDSTIWGGNDIYDVYSQSDLTALDGTPYNTW
ncbi:type II secretion system protein [Desulfuromonas sp. AOP6]|uniref:type II secretion system protein n=1 Tax=Desulfuromonas sp. AOP6 TaxID=1566351 RepID=UPI0012723E1B|nr:type II secretion system protein [Desulfuromonas sp. AOP6]BCA80178.1 type II secretion system pseudopilin PulG [Desulfuromonas sp. AOP6]